MRRRELRADEPDDDLGAACDVRLRTLSRRRDARHPVACAGDVCAELLHRIDYPALWRRARDGGWAGGARAVSGGGGFLGHRRALFWGARAPPRGGGALRFWGGPPGGAVRLRR